LENRAKTGEFAGLEELIDLISDEYKMVNVALAEILEQEHE